MTHKYLISLLLISTFSFSQQTQYVNFKHIEAVLQFNQIQVDSTVFNTYEVTFDILKPTDSIYLDAKHMKFKNLVLNGTEVNYKNTGKTLTIYNKFEPSKNNTLKFLFFASPKKAMYFVGWDNASRNQIWTQGQGKYTSHWLPSIDDMNDKIEFDLSVVAPKDYQVISNGKMISKKESPSYHLWEFDMQNPMSSYLVALVIGKYDKKMDYSKSGTPIELYYYPEDSLKFEPTYRYTKQIFDFLESEIGVPYPWQNYKQVPVKDFLYAGMENTSTTIFADSFVIDSIAFVDKNYVNVNAHELAHQWFGNLVTATSGTHHWLQEGFATYYALLAERTIFGDDYYYGQLYEYAQELLEQDRAGASTALLNPKSSSTTFYKKGAWVLYLLRKKVGDKAFKQAVKNYLLNHQFKNVKTEDFITEIEKTSKTDLAAFVSIWLEDATFYYDTCLKHLKNDSKDISALIDLNTALSKASDTANFDVNLYFKNTKSSKLRSRLFSKDIITLVADSTLKQALHAKDLKLRQTIALNLTQIPSAVKTNYESLLLDKSYITIEAALFNLWSNFPQEQHTYLNQTKGIEGFNDKNIKILWLTLALITEDFEMENKKVYFNELTNYTRPEYGFEVRQNAFQYLSQIQACDKVCKDNLAQATKHHNWRFSKFAKGLLQQVK